MRRRLGLMITEIMFREYSDPEQLASELADELARQMRLAVNTSGSCHMVFPGGRSPRRTLELLRNQKVPWSALHLYPSDERCVPVGDSARNDRLIDEILLPYVPLRLENLHRIPAELGPEEGALRFSQLLKNTPPFDIVLVGVGIDGHIASLFPNHLSVLDDMDAVPVLKAPKPPPFRVSIGLGRLKGAHRRHVVAQGTEKRDLLSSPERFRDTPVMKLNATIWYAEGKQHEEILVPITTKNEIV